jgi:hypothetical protein
MGYEPEVSNVRMPIRYEGMSRKLIANDQCIVVLDTCSVRNIEWPLRSRGERRFAPTRDVGFSLKPPFTNERQQSFTSAKTRRPRLRSPGYW